LGIWGIRGRQGRGIVADIIVVSEECQVMSEEKTRESRRV
jgi:predicted nucleic acid-binding Zn ribbon protein